MKKLFLKWSSKVLHYFLEKFNFPGDDLADDDLMEELLGKDKAQQLKKKIESEQSPTLALAASWWTFS